MPNFQERYRNGEYVQVWDELMALGGQVRQEPFYSDALAVARETMTRVRQNIDTLYERLRKIGYLFENSETAYTPVNPSVIKNMHAFEREVGPIPLSILACAEIIGSVDFVGNYPGLSYYAPSTPSNFGSLINSGFLESPGFQQAIQKLGYGTFPQEWTDRVKKKYQSEQLKPSARVNHADIGVTYADPLCISLVQFSSKYYRAWKASLAEMDEPLEPGEAEGRIMLSIAPDIYHKSNYSGGGGYDLSLPDANVDAVLLNEDHHQTFVGYLRNSFAWAGFPGLEREKGRDDNLLTMLREGLLPF